MSNNQVQNKSNEEVQNKTNEEVQKWAAYCEQLKTSLQDAHSNAQTNYNYAVKAQETIKSHELTIKGLNGEVAQLTKQLNSSKSATDKFRDLLGIVEKENEDLKAKLKSRKDIEIDISHKHAAEVATLKEEIEKLKEEIKKSVEQKKDLEVIKKEEKPLPNISFDINDFDLDEIKGDCLGDYGEYGPLEEVEAKPPESVEKVQEVKEVQVKGVQEEVEEVQIEEEEEEEEENYVTSEQMNFIIQQFNETMDKQKEEMEALRLEVEYLKSQKIENKPTGQYDEDLESRVALLEEVNDGYQKAGFLLNHINYSGIRVKKIAKVNPEAGLADLVLGSNGQAAEMEIERAFEIVVKDMELLNQEQKYVELEGQIEGKGKSYSVGGDNIKLGTIKKKAVPFNPEIEMVLEFKGTQKDVSGEETTAKWEIIGEVKDKVYTKASRRIQLHDTYDNEGNFKATFEVAM